MKYSTAIQSGVQHALESVSERVILPKFRHLAASDIIEKSPGDLVTIADKESEAMLRDALSALLPEAAFVGEEAAAADPDILNSLHAPLCWIVDPIDGTHNYAHGQPPFGIIIALCVQGETVAGWLYDPLARRLCHAWQGGGAFVGDEMVYARPTDRGLPVAAISQMFLDDRQRTILKEAVAPHYHCVDIPRCAAEQYPRLVLGQNDISLFERVLPWDHAAGILFLNEAGGMAARPDGRTYAPTQTERGLIGAASPRLYEQMATLLAKTDWFDD